MFSLKIKAHRRHHNAVFLFIKFSILFILFILFFCIYWAFKTKPQKQNFILIIARYAIIDARSNILCSRYIFKQPYNLYDIHGGAV